MNIFGKLFLAVLLLPATAFAQGYNMNMDQDLTAWNPCVLPLCAPGGSGVPTKIIIAGTGTKWPPHSLELSVTGPAWTNFLAWDKVGATSANYFQSDFWAYVPTAFPQSSYQALEYDIFAFNSPYRYMFGSQCVIGAEWQIWDDLHGNWIDTALSCSLLQGKWHHIQWWVHRVSGDTSCDGYPCMWYDMLGVDGVYTQFGTREPAGPIPAGWSNDSGLNVQLDISGVSGDKTITEYMESVNFTELDN